MLHPYMIGEHGFCLFDAHLPLGCSDKEARQRGVCRRGSLAGRAARSVAPWPPEFATGLRTRCQRIATQAHGRGCCEPMEDRRAFTSIPPGTS